VTVFLVVTGMIGIARNCQVMVTIHEIGSPVCCQIYGEHTTKLVKSG